MDSFRIGRVVGAALLMAGVCLLPSCGGGESSSSRSSSFVAPGISLAGLTQLSSDTFTNSASQHATEVEPSAFASGSTIVAAFQVGRIFGGGAAALGFATSTDGGVSWSNGILPGITTLQGGAFSAGTDPSVAFDAAHGVWIVSSLGLAGSAKVLVSRSPDGLTWGLPAVVSGTPDADKNWIACDNTPTSLYYGNCYLEWDDPSVSSGLIWMKTSSDGGLTWGPARNTANHASGIGGEPVIQPDGTVVVPIANAAVSAMLAFHSTDGGATWSATTSIAAITDHGVAGGMRTEPLPSAQVDDQGNIYVVWQDCRFRSGCSANDIVLSTSAEGTTWTAPKRVPIDSSTSGIDHFIASIGVDPASGGASAHLGVSYYFFSNTNCAVDTCQLNAGFISSQDGGNSWSAPASLAGPMSLTWLPNTVSGLMVGDYTAVVFSGGAAFPVFAAANINNGSRFNEAIYTTPQGLVTSASQVRVTATEQIRSLHSDHPPRRFVDLEHRYRKPAE